MIIFIVALPVVWLQKYREWEGRKLTQGLTSSGEQVRNLLFSCQRPMNLNTATVAGTLCFQLEWDKKLLPFLCPNPLKDKITQFQVWFKLTCLNLCWETQSPPSQCEFVVSIAISISMHSEHESIHHTRWFLNGGVAGPWKKLGF